MHTGIAVRFLFGLSSSSDDVDEIDSTACRVACLIGVVCFGLAGEGAFLACFLGVTGSSSESVKTTVLAFSRGALIGRFLPRLCFPPEFACSAGCDVGVALAEYLAERGGVAGTLMQNYIAKYRL